MVTIKMKTDNAAFEEGGKAQEIARILRELADKLEGYDLTSGKGSLRDVNGNVIGSYSIR